MDIREVISQKCAAVEPVMKGYAVVEDSEIRDMILHPINAGGKRIRPALTLLACEAVGGDAQKALPAAASVELLHTFTLVHDDIMDHDMERRGKPTVHSLWGEEMGILIGDALYSSAFLALSDLKNKGVPAVDVLSCIDALIKANTEVHMGQIKDMLFEKKEVVSQDMYLDMIRKKTGALIEASVKIGAIVGGANTKQLEAFERYGSNCGLAFQVKDDILDLIADSKEFGKPVGSDIRSGKKTLMVLHAFENGSDEEVKRLKSVLGRLDASDEEVSKAIEILKSIGSIDYAEKMVSNLIDEAKLSLDIMNESDAQKHLKSIADYLVARRI